jgi:hypothetical protein
MHNNIQSGWRPAITKIILTAGLVYLILFCASIISAALVIESKWTCGATKEVYESLSRNGEEIVATGTVDDRFVMTFWTNSDADWSLVVTSVKTFEASCVVIYGNNHRKLRAKTYI